ncbi:RICIN domain-containing protein [Streptosporangium sp. NPDC004379]|uniref:RICIN domain-containing protein n=1 Tax=Streptosporangium sp. NPDC004379 TaxID=3366189 RepID=UPI0036749414
MAVLRPAHRSALTLVTAAALFVPVLPAAAHARTDPATGLSPEGQQSTALTGMLVNGQTGKCLTVAGGGRVTDNLRAAQYECDAYPTRQWTMTDATGTRQYTLRNAQTGKCLTIAGGASTANNYTAVQYTCMDHPAFRWMFWGAAGAQQYQLKNVQTGKCLTIGPDGSTAVQYTCDKQPARMWGVRYM